MVTLLVPGFSSQPGSRYQSSISSLLISAAKLVFDRLLVAFGVALGVNLVLGVAGWLVSVVVSGGAAPVAAKAAAWIPFWIFGVLLEGGRLQDVCPD